MPPTRRRWWNWPRSVKADVIVNACDPRINEPICAGDGSTPSIDGFDFAPTFSIWTTIEEPLNPALVWERDRGLFTTECFSEQEILQFPAGIGPQECFSVEHEEVVLIPREISCSQVTFTYGVDATFVDWLKTFAYLGLDSKHKIRVGDVSVAPRDVLAAVLPNPAKLGHLMHGRTCAGTRVKGTHDDQPREIHLSHVADNETTMRQWGSQAVLWQTAVCPVVALELLANGTWNGTGVRGAAAFDAVPFLNLLGEYNTHHGMIDMGSGLWPSPRPTSSPGSIDCHGFVRRRIQDCTWREFGRRPGRANGRRPRHRRWPIPPACGGG